MSTKVIDFYENENDFEKVLEEAETKGSGDFENGFVASMRERFDKYGNDMFLSPKQKAVLDKILNKGELKND